MSEETQEDKMAVAKVRCRLIGTHEWERKYHPSKEIFLRKTCIHCGKTEETLKNAPGGMKELIAKEYSNGNFNFVHQEKVDQFLKLPQDQQAAKKVLCRVTAGHDWRPIDVKQYVSDHHIISRRTCIHCGAIEERDEIEGKRGQVGISVWRDSDGRFV